MRIKSLEISGFKSFVDPVKLSFEPGITALVGPNGCGKSNIIDAVRWIMGEHNARHLRGSKMEDLIFNGSQTRKSNGMAEVSMTLSNINSNGNGNGNGNGHETGTCESSSLSNQLMVTRKLFRSGESEYFINKVACRLKDIVELFLDSGVGTKSYSIMEQGKVDYILSLKPDERRILIEEAAGISKYRSRKKEAVNKMNSTKNNLHRLNDLLNEIKIQMHTLGLQVKRLKRHRTLTEEIRNIDLLLAAVRLKEFNKSTLELKEQLTKFNDEEINLTAKRNTTEANLEKNRFELEELQKKIEETSQEYFTYKEAIQNNESTIQLNESELQNTHSLIEKSNLIIKELTEDLENINHEIIEKNNELETLSQKISLLEDDFNKSSEALSESRSILSSTHDKIENEKKELMQIMIKRTEIVNSIKLNTRIQEEISQKNQKIEQETKFSLTTNNELNDKIKKQNNSINDISSKLKNKNISINSQSVKIIDLKTNLTEKTNTYNAIKDELGNKKAHLNSLQELQNNLEGFDEGVRNLMSINNDDQSEITGLVGLLADFIVTEKENETALESALGRKLQTVIFNSTEDGLKAIEYLKNQNNGKISFQTASTVKQNQSSQNISNCIPLLQLIKSKSNNDEIINSLLSDVYLVDNLSSAIKIWQNSEEKYTFVTPSGDLIDSRGTVSGGSNVNSGSGILKRNREIREYTESINQLEVAFSTIKEAKENIERELNESNILLEQLTKDQNELNILLVQETTIHEQLKRENLLEEEKLTLLKNEANENSELLAKHQNDIKLLKLDSDLLEKEDQKKQAYLSELTASEIDQRESLLKIETEHTELRILLASIKQKKESLTNDIARLNNDLTVSRTKIDNLKIDKYNLESSTGTLSNNIETIKNHQQSKILKSQELSKLIEEERVSYHSLKELVDTDNELLKSLRTRWDEIEPKVREIELKLNEASLNTKHLEEALAEKYAVSITHLPSPPEEDSFKIDESKERLDKLKNRLENIGDVNLGAAKEFEELENRYNFLNEQADDLHQSIDSLQKVILKINKITRQKFADTFNEINNHFKELFPLLFNGGKAYMQLTEEANILETGIDIFAQPPGKKLQSLDLLSGGERALTVISLMFAIFLTKPSPFCLMDEIDAPLDDSNIGRFISHLHKMAKRSQFLIVTHNKLSMQAADSLYGVTMEEKGVSKIVSVDLN